MDLNINHLLKIAGELNITIKQIEATATLLDEGATVPFISRYRKEVTGSPYGAATRA
jgi:protein Tex